MYSFLAMHLLSIKAEAMANQNLKKGKQTLKLRNILKNNEKELELVLLLLLTQFSQ